MIRIGIDWYLTFYDKESGEILGESYLYSLCYPCSTGSASNASSNNDTKTLTFSWTSFVNEPLEEAANAPKITFHHTASVVLIKNLLVNVIVYPVTANPMVSYYLDRNGRKCTRTLTLFGQNNSWTELSNRSILANWSWFTHYLITFLNGDPSYSTSRYKTASKVYTF